MRTILFVCSGNTCRSPMAEAIARHWTNHGLIEGEAVGVESAGTSAMEGMPPAAEMRQAIARWDIEHEGASRRLTAEMLRRVEAVFCMTSAHQSVARELAGGDRAVESRILMLDPEDDIDDPIGMGQAAYDALAEQLMDLIPQRLKEVLAHEDRTGSGSSRR